MTGKRGQPLRRNPPLQPDVVAGLLMLATTYNGALTPEALAAGEWIRRVAANERDRMAMRNPHDRRFQIVETQRDGSERIVYGSNDICAAGQMYEQMQKLGWTVRMHRDGREQVVGRSGRSYVIDDEIDFGG